MPNTKSAAKAMRKSARRRAYNQTTKTKFRAAIKDLKKAIESAEKAKSVEALQKAFATLDKAAKKGVIHKNQASRKKSRLARAVNKLK